MKEQRIMLKQTALLTVVAINLMLGSLLVVRNFVKVEGVTHVVATSTEDRIRTDYVMEYVGSKQVNETPTTSPTGHKGTWVVEHYKEYEYHYNKNGEILYKKPTSKEENIRYWSDKNNHFN